METSHFNGAISEATFARECLRRRWQIARPVADLHGYDFVIRPASSWYTVQVKTAYVPAPRSTRMKPQNALMVNLRRRQAGKNVPYKEGDFDLAAVVHGDKIWLIPWPVIDAYHSHCSLSSYERFLLTDDSAPILACDDALLAEVLFTKSVCKRRRLTPEQVTNARAAYLAGESRQSIQTKLGCGKTVLSRILRGEGYPDCWPDELTEAALKSALSEKSNWHRGTSRRPST